MCSQENGPSRASGWDAASGLLGLMSWHVTTGHIQVGDAVATKPKTKQLLWTILVNVFFTFLHTCWTCFNISVSKRPVCNSFLGGN